MRRSFLGLVLLLPVLVAGLAAAPEARAQERAGAPAGRFDLYILALSWQPGWCAATGDARGAPECADGGQGAGDSGFILHGLWPQYDRGWPAWCDAVVPDPGRGATGAMADIMGSGGLAWYQWRKHGRCTGLSAPAYFTAARRAFDAVTLPGGLVDAAPGTRLSPAALAARVRADNPRIPADGLRITCRDGWFREIRICLTRLLEPRRCPASMPPSCGASGMRLAVPGMEN